MSEQELATLWSKYVNNRMTVEERLRFSQLAGEEACREQLEELVAAFLSEHEPRIRPYTDKKKAFELVMEEVRQRENNAGITSLTPARSFFRQWKWVAAVLLLVGAAAGFFILRPHKSLPVQITYNYVQQASSKVLLIQDDGAPVGLDTISTRQPGTLRNAVINNGVLTYKRDAEKSSYNTLRTATGALYQIVLSDGTKVWLNALSSIRYPTSFDDKERLVTVTGEAYFEIAPDASRPFVVKTDSMRVQVLGTHFNIRTYKEEQFTKTTLLQGSVNILPDGQHTGYRLLPGEQSILQAGNVKKVKLQDADAVIAWVKGEFNFESADIQAVFGEIGRWYGMNIRLEPTVRKHRFTGIISREYTMMEALTALQTAGVQYHIDGNTIVVTR